MKRYTSIDLLRGLIMIFMALDHCSLMVGRLHFSELWGVDFYRYPDFMWWLTRFVSHLCAPGFFLTMGMSIYLFADKSRSEDWSVGRIRAYFLKRGGLILLIMFFLEIPAFVLEGATNQASLPSVTLPGQFTGGFFFPGTVLYGLGICMITSAFLWRLGKTVLLLITIASFAFSTGYLSTADPGVPYSPLMHMLLVPGMSNGAFILYPIVPWLGVTTFGIFLAQRLKERPEIFYGMALKTGITFFVAFLLVRGLGWGNFQIDTYEDWISFFTLIKYPPSISFFLCTVGVLLILLNLFSKSFGQAWLKPVLIFGQTAMFFYIIHLHFYAYVGLAFREGTSIWVMYVIWLLGLSVFYYICSWYLKFKRSRGEGSIWRMI